MKDEKIQQVVNGVYISPYPYNNYRPMELEEYKEYVKPYLDRIKELFKDFNHPPASPKVLTEIVKRIDTFFFELLNSGEISVSIIVDLSPDWYFSPNKTNPIYRPYYYLSEEVPLTPIIPSLDVFSFNNNDEEDVEEEDEERTLEDYSNEELLEELRRRLTE